MENLYSSCFSPDGKLLACASGGGVTVFDVASLEQRLFMRGDFAFGASFSPDGQLLAIPSAQLGLVRLWNLVNNREVATLSSPDPPLGAIFTPDGKKLIVTSYGVARVWNLAGTGDRRVLAPHAGAVPVVAFSPDGKLLAAGSKDRSVSLWKPVTGECVQRITDLPSAVQTLAFSPDGRWLAVGAGARALIFSAADWRKRAELPPLPGGGIWSLAISPDGTLLAAGNGGGVRIWQIAWDTLQFTPVAAPTRELSASLAFSPDGRRLAWVERVGFESHVQFWDRGQAHAQELKGAHPAHWICSLDFAPDGRLTFVSVRTEAEAWDLVGGVRVHAFGGAEIGRHSGAGVWSTISSLSPDGKWYAVANRAVSIWDVQRGRLLLALPREASQVLSLAWSPNRDFLAVGGADGGLAVWDLPTVRAQLGKLGLDW